MGEEHSPQGDRDDIERLGRAFAALPPRDGRLAAQVLVDELPRARCAAHYGISLEAADVWLLRALRGWSEELGQAQPPEVPYALERRQARALAAVLDGTLPPEDPDVPRPALSFARRVRARAPSLRQLFADWEREAPPPRPWEKWLRLAVALTLIALALLLSR